MRTIALEKERLAREVPDRIAAMARELRTAGGRALVVGGWVRDQLLGIPTKDLDLEVYGLDLDRLEAILARHGEVVRVGRAFGVLRIKGLDVDFSVPRRDSRIGPGHRGFQVEGDPDMAPEEAVRRRDLTINALMFDPLTGMLLDPAGGLDDLRSGRLRAVDPATFADDPLRPVRVAQMAARLEYRIDPDLVLLCRGIRLQELPPERLWAEWVKMLIRGVRPSLGLAFLQQAEMLELTPQLEALVGVPQDPLWHPEGDVWEHTLQAVDAAAGLRIDEGEADLALMFGALCHDLGKAPTTAFQDGRWRSHEHEDRGVERARALLGQLGAPGRLTGQVAVLVRCHLRPGQLVRHGAGARAYRRLARELQGAGVTLELLERVARADALGRQADGAEPPGFPEGTEFLRVATELQVRDRAPRDVVLGRHLIARGLDPGPTFGPILARCREVQDEAGWKDPQRILDRVLRD